MWQPKTAVHTSQLASPSWSFRPLMWKHSRIRSANKRDHWRYCPGHHAQLGSQSASRCIFMILLNPGRYADYDRGIPEGKEQGWGLVKRVSKMKSGGPYRGHCHWGMTASTSNLIPPKPYGRSLLSLPRLSDSVRCTGTPIHRHNCRWRVRL